MRSFRRASACSLALALTAASCDTTQPLQVSEQTVNVKLAAHALAELWDVYDVAQDTSNPPDGVPDQDRPDLARCRLAREPGTLLPLAADRPIPWRVSAEISVIEAGSTTRKILATSFDDLDRFSSVLEYDGLVATADPAPPPIDTYSFKNGIRVSTASRVFLDRCPLDSPAPGAQQRPEVPHFDDLFGASPDDTPPNSNVLGMWPTFDVVLKKGETIIVEARKILDSSSSVPTRSSPILSVEMTLGGRAVSLQGTASSTAESGTGFSVSYTLR